MFRSSLLYPNKFWIAGRMLKKELRFITASEPSRLTSAEASAHFVSCSFMGRNLGTFLIQWQILLFCRRRLDERLITGWPDSKLAWETDSDSRWLLFLKGSLMRVSGTACEKSLWPAKCQQLNWSGKRSEISVPPTWYSLAAPAPAGPGKARQQGSKIHRLLPAHQYIWPNVWHL